MKRALILVAVVATFASVASAQQPVSPVVPLKANWFAPEAVHLLDGPFQKAMLRNQDYLLRLDADRLLHTFRLNVGLPSSAQPYGGWEAPNVELRGHSLGHYLTALSLQYAGTGDERFRERAAYIVAELAKCQAASPSKGFHEGYLSAFPESFIDRVETRQSVWAPYYTLHKIMAGLLDAHQYTRNGQALDVLRRMADWVDFRVSHLTPEQMQASLNTEFGGMNDVLAGLYEATGEQKYLRLAQAFDHKRIFDPLAEGKDALNGLHANTQIPKMIGAALEYELTGDQRYAKIANTFWDRVVNDRSYAIGGHSDDEHFFPVDQFARHLGPGTAETCNTYNMLKLTRHLFKWDPSARTMDYYERALYNHILASQDPDQGMFVYLMSLRPGGFKSYSTPENSFWCCVGTGMENHAKYQTTIYAYDANTLFVNLFIASELNWAEKGVVVRQETTFPETDRTRLTIRAKQPVELALKIRYPSWATQGMEIRVNGKSQPVEGQPGSYATVSRTWRDGDRLEVRLPMAIRAEDLPGAPQMKAILYGPVVLAGTLGTKDLPDQYVKDQWELHRIPAVSVPAFHAYRPDWLNGIRRVKGDTLAFRVQGQGMPDALRLIPFYALHHQRYTVYWPVLDQGSNQ